MSQQHNTLNFIVKYNLIFSRQAPIFAATRHKHFSSLNSVTKYACASLIASGVMWSVAAHAQTNAPPAQTDGSVVLPPVSVTVDAVNNDVPPVYTGGQVSTGARLGLLGNVDVMDTPFNVTSYTSELIRNRQARTIGDVLVNDPSVRFTTSTGHAYENFRLRGFDVNQNDLALNGMYGLLPIGHTPVEMFERVEVLKGPSALFSGMSPSGAVGGTINLVPKRAGDDPLNRVSLGYQSDGQVGTSFDVARRFGLDKSLGVRLNGSFSNGDTSIDGQRKKREFLSAALDYQRDGLKASVDTYYSKETYKGGTASQFWFASTDIPSAPDPAISQFPAAWGDLESKAIVGRVEYSFSPYLAAFAAVGVRKHDYSGFINGNHLRQLNAAGTSTSTVTVGQRGYDDSVSSEAGLRGNFDTFGMTHQVVLQGSRLDMEAGSASASSAFTTNIYNPTYHDMPAVPGYAPKNAENTLSSLALVDTMSFLRDRVRLTLGARYQKVETTNFNTSGSITSAYEKSAVTPAVALVVKPWGPGISFYANYVQGLSKGDSVSTPTYAFNKTFAPYKTEQKEVGVKWDAGSFTHTVSAFEITKPTLIMVNGNEPSDGGEKRVRGLEWNTFGEVVQGVRLLGGVSYTDGIQTKTANGLYDGNTAVGAPRWQANLGVEWDPRWVRGLTLSSRVIATSSQYMDAANTQKIPGWGVLDLGARYAFESFGRPVVVRLDAANIFDRHYYSGAFSDTTPIATLGLGRTVMASATVDF